MIGRAAIFLACLSAVCWLRLGPIRALAQAVPQAPPMRFADPAGFLDRLFGAEPEEDRKAVDAVPLSPAEERQIGQAMVDAFLAEAKRQKLPVVTRGKDVQYLQDLVETIRPKMTHADRYRTINVYLVRSPLVDARSAPGGTLVFFRGLLDSVDSEAAVVSVVAHELSHLDRGHQLVRAKRMKLAQQSFQQRAGQSSPMQSMGLALQAVQIWTRPFRPEDETAADRDAARWAFESGYDPRAMLDVLEAIRRQKKGLTIPLPFFLRSHPAPETRGEDVLKVFKELTGDSPGAKLYLGKENLRRRVALSRHRFPE